MKFGIIGPILLLCFCTMSFGQVIDAEKKLLTKSADSTQGWKKGGVFSLNLAQTSLTNWAAGGQNSFAVNGLLSTFANYKRDKTVWVNSLDIGYGLLKQEWNDRIRRDYRIISSVQRNTWSGIFL